MRDRLPKNIPDGGVLLRLDNGLFVVRRRKHEWTRKVDALSGKKLKRLTDKIRGSKFFREWTLARVVDLICVEAMRKKWTRDTVFGRTFVIFHETVGYSEGRRVHTIAIEISSGAIHAYPVED